VRSDSKEEVVIGWLFVLTGVIGFVYHLGEVDPRNPFSNDALWVLVVRVLAVVGGVLLLRGIRAARWILIGWMVYHVILSAMHGVVELVIHIVILAVVAWFLLRPARGGQPGTPV
jgi:hypothetical protein